MFDICVRKEKTGDLRRFCYKKTFLELSVEQRIRKRNKLTNKTRSVGVNRVVLNLYDNKIELEFQLIPIKNYFLVDYFCRF